MDRNAEVSVFPASAHGEPAGLLLMEAVSLCAMQRTVLWRCSDPANSTMQT